MSWIGRAVMLAALVLAAPASADDAADLAAMIRSNSWPVDVQDKGLAGTGAQQIAAWSDDAQFFLLGEDHGSAGLARFATALSDMLATHGYRYTVVEVDPLMTRQMASLLSNGKPAFAAWLRTDGRERAIPFYSWSEEADFIVSSMRRGNVWGIDQTFIAAAALHLDEIARRTKSVQVRSMASRFAAEARSDPMNFLGKVDPARLQAMLQAMPKREDAQARVLADQIVQSAIIYHPFVTGQGSDYPANLLRETQMKQRFIADFDAAWRHDGVPPKVLFKMGANHLARGLSPTHIPSVGDFAAEMALGRLGKPVLNLQMMCGPGAAVADFDGGSTACDEGFDKTLGQLRPFLSASSATLFDLRPLRSHARLWKSWPADAKALVWTYDAIVVVQGGGASHFLAPPSPKAQ